MSRIGIFMADGCEEIEGLTVVDIARRAGIEIDTISITGQKKVTGSHKVSFEADVISEQVDFSIYEGIVLPGGMPGTLHLGENDTVKRVIREFAEAGKMVAAICAAPGVLGQEGLLAEKKAVCHPGFEEKLAGAKVSFEPVMRDGNIITSRGMGTAIPFALEIVRYFADDAAVDKIKAGLVYA